MIRPDIPVIRDDFSIFETDTVPDDNGRMEAHPNYQRALSLAEHLRDATGREWRCMGLEPLGPDRTRWKWIFGIECHRLASIPDDHLQHLTHGDLGRLARELLLMFRAKLEGLHERTQLVVPTRRAR